MWYAGYVPGIVCLFVFFFSQYSNNNNKKEEAKSQEKKRANKRRWNESYAPRYRQQWIIELVYSLNISPFPIRPIAYAFSLFSPSLSLTVCMSPIKHRNIVTFVWWYFCNEFLSGIYRCAIASMCFFGVCTLWFSFASSNWQSVFVYLNDVQLPLYKHRQLGTTQNSITLYPNFVLVCEI